jgi:hypothetical protein
MKRVTEYAGRLRRARAVGILLNDGRVVSYPLRPTSLAGDLNRHQLSRWAAGRRTAD